jgi:hypothetical protein
MTDHDDDQVAWILPPGIQTSYDRKMKLCKAGWQETGDPWAAAEASTLATLHRQLPPAWVDEAMWALACAGRTKDHAWRARERAIRLMRYQAVRDAHRDGMSWEKACEHAAKAYASNLEIAATPDQMWKAYKRVKKDLKKGRGGLYFTPKFQQARSK